LGKLFAGYGERVGPGVLGFLVTRCRYIDDYLQACLNAGLEQLVILGAGLDSRAYRFPALKKGVKVFEVDHPATQQAKQAKLKSLFGELPAHVTFVPIDFSEESLDKLFSFGYDRQLKTLFIWEGVVQYLQADAVEQTLDFVRRNAPPASRIIFDYVYAAALTAARQRGEIARMRRSARFTGEQLVFGIEEGTVTDYLRSRGFSQVTNVTSRDLEQAYLANQDRTVAPIYAIVHATVAG
jgi:methyltransferase (TIGR00027 family)